MSITKAACVAMAVCALAACTTMDVQPIPSSAGIKHVCIELNPKVQVSDFVPVVRSRLSFHDVSSVVFTGPKPEGCEYVMTYTATRKWDITPYMVHAEVRIERDNKQVGEAIFHLTGGGGLDLTKFDSTKIKMEPVIDALMGRAQARVEVR